MNTATHTYASPLKRKIRMAFLYTWLIVPVLGLAVHYQFGVHALKEDRAWQQVKQAHKLEKTAFETMTVEDWAAAEDAYSEAIEILEGKESAGPRARLELARARCTLYKGELIESMDDLAAQLYRAEARGMDDELLRDIRETLARAEFGIAWIMRYEGASAAAWQPCAESARQHFRHLSETAPDGERAGDYLANLESTVGLSRRDLAAPRSRKTDGPGRTSPREARNAAGQGLPAEAENAAGQGTPQEAQNAAGQGTPQEAENAAGQGTPQEAQNAAGQGTPQEAQNAAGQGMPQEAANAAGQGMPQEAANAAGQGMPQEAMNAMGQGAMPSEAMNAAGQSAAITDEMIGRMQGEGQGDGEGITENAADIRDRFSRGASGGRYTGGGS